MEISDIPQGAQGKYNQAFFIQLRLHELWLRIDRMSTNLLDNSNIFNLYNYEVVFNDLCSILKMVLPYLNAQDTKEIKEQRKNIREFLDDNQIYTSKRNGQRIIKIFNRKNWNKLREMIYEFELNIELISHKHGLGNPTKEDPSRAVIN